MVFKVRFKVTNPNGSRDRDIEIKKSLEILLVTKTPKQKASIIIYIIYLMNLSLVLWNAFVIIPRSDLRFFVVASVASSVFSRPCRFHLTSAVI